MARLDRALGRLRRMGRPAWIVVRPVGGMANRLRAVTSCQALAHRLHLPFAMLWERTHSFSAARWEDLFANDLPRWDRERYERYRSGRALDLGSWIGWADVRPPDPSFHPERALRDIAARGLVWDHGFHNADRLLERRRVPGMRRVARLRHRFCRELRPTEPIARRVEAYAGEHFRGRIVGVHIRRGDALDSPRAQGHLRSSDEAFASEMEEMLAGDPGLRFFLATDCEKTLAAFRERFGARIIAAEKDFVPAVFGEPKDGQEGALVDMFLLSRTERVLGTYASTFGRMAAHIGGIRYRDAGGGGSPLRLDGRWETDAPTRP